MKNSNANHEAFYTSHSFVGCVILLILLLIPLGYANPYFLRLAVLTFIYCILTVSLSLLLDFTGVISLGQAAFFGIGAYATGVLSTKMGLGIWLTLPSSGVVAAVIAALFGVVTLKSLKGIYFALASWALVEVLCSVYMNVDFFGGTNGIRGIPEPVVFGLQIATDTSFYYLTLIFAVAALLCVERLLSSRHGRAWMAIREDQTVAAVMGINVLSCQIMSLAIAGLLAGLAGSLYAYYEVLLAQGCLRSGSPSPSCAWCLLVAGKALSAHWPGLPFLPFSQKSCVWWASTE